MMGTRIINPTIEKITEHFRLAKTVKCLSDELIYDISGDDVGQVFLTGKGYYWVNESNGGRAVMLCHGGDVAEILSYIAGTSTVRMDNLHPCDALDTQVGGSHYKDMKIQPIEFIVGNNIPYREANVIKYISRHKSKNGVEDLKKARHYIDMLIDEYEN